MPSILSGQIANAERPFEMLAIGDSVVWGQGLQHDHKFSTLVAKWIENEKLTNGRKVSLYYGNAHSGASVTFRDDITPHPPYSGEVNVYNPSILEQVNSSLIYYKTRKTVEGGPLTPDKVDLILVDGGINDMGAMSIVNLFYRKIDLNAAAETHCRKKMAEQLLPKIASTYPNARIVVTGYFPLISRLSDVHRFWEMLLHLFPADQLLNVLDSVGIARLSTKFAFMPLSLLKLALSTKSGKAILANAPAYASGVVGAFRNQLADRSDLWYQTSNQSLRIAVNQANSSLPITGAIQFSQTNPRVIFASPTFLSANCFASPQPFLWELDGLKTNDELYSNRQTDCKVLTGQRGNLITCHRAGLFHPNVAGASAYFDSIKQNLQVIWPQTDW
ncbi:MAG: hypothetical protein ACKVQJ_00440 [Pyrinomonadaceae bacterium]